MFAVAWVLLLVLEALAAETSLEAALAGTVALGLSSVATLLVDSILGKSSSRGSLVASIVLVPLATVAGLATSVGALIYAPDFAGSRIEWIEGFLNRLVVVGLGAGLLFGLVGILLQATSAARPWLNRRGRLLCVTAIGVAAVATGATVALTRWASSLGIGP